MTARLCRWPLAVPALVCIAWASSAVGQRGAAVEAMQEYMDFAEYGEGAIATEQILDAGVAAFTFVDVRSPVQYQAEHIPGAMNIEWRQILARRAELPDDRPAVLYCDTGLLSSKAQFALRVAGVDNVKVLYGGLLMWRAQRGLQESRDQAGAADQH